MGIKRTKTPGTASPLTDSGPLKNLFQARKFLDNMAASIRNIIYASFPSMSSAEREDVEQEVKLKLWRMASNGKNIENFRSYLWKVVYTTAYDVIEDRLGAVSLDAMSETQNRRLLSRLDVASGPSTAAAQEASLTVEKAVRSLPQRRRSVVRLYCLGLDHKQIAKSLALSEPQARHLLYRGLNEVKKKIRGAEISALAADMGKSKP